MEQDKRGIIKFLVAMAVVIAVFAAGYAVTYPSLKAKVYEFRVQSTYVPAFYCFSFNMEAVADPSVYGLTLTPSWEFWPMLFVRVEYVMEFPPEKERGWAVIYIKPGMGTEPALYKLNNAIQDDPDIVIDERLTLPLTEEQIVAYPDAVLEIIEQLDRGQWERFYSEEEITRPIAERLARQAGIEVPAE